MVKKVPKKVKKKKTVKRYKGNFTVAEVKKALEEAHFSVLLAADLLDNKQDSPGCCFKTVYNYIKRYPSLKAFYDEHKEPAQKAFVTKCLFKLVEEGNHIATIFLYKVLYGLVDRKEDMGGREQVEIIYKTEIINNQTVTTRMEPEVE